MCSSLIYTLRYVFFNIIFSILKWSTFTHTLHLYRFALRDIYQIWLYMYKESDLGGGAFTAHLVSPHLAKQWMWNVWLHSIVRTGVPSTDSSCERTKSSFLLEKINMYTWYSRYTMINVATLNALSLWILTTNEKKKHAAINQYQNACS